MKTCFKAILIIITHTQWRNWQGEGVRAAPPGKLNVKNGPRKRLYELQNMKEFLQFLEIRWSWHFKYWNSAVLSQPKIIKWIVNSKLLQCSDVYCTIYNLECAYCVWCNKMDVWRIFVQIFTNLPKSFLCNFCLQIFSRKDRKTFFGVTSKRGLYVFFCKPLA